jgi:hypothetical protein
VLQRAHGHIGTVEARSLLVISQQKAKADNERTIRESRAKLAFVFIENRV